MPAITARQLNRATLERQLLLRREPIDVVEAVHRVVGLQAQEPGSPYVALWNRVRGFEAADLDRAFAEHAIVKASLMRITLHAVDVEDYPAFHEAMQVSLRGSRLGDRRFTSTGLTAAQADALVPQLLEFAEQPRSNAEMEARLAQVHDTHGRAWWAIRTYGPLWHAPVGRPWAFGPRPSYVAARTSPFEGDRSAALRHLGRRYLEGFGPASLADLSQFALIYRPLAREALEAQADTLVRLEGPGGTELFDVPGGTIPDEDAPAPPRLLGMWDSALLAYADRSRIVPPAYRRLVSQSNGDLLPTVLVDGYVAGVWRPTDDGIEVTAFEKLAANAWRGIEGEAAGLLAFLADRDPTLYRRYGRWWASLPSAQRRTVGR